MSNKIGVNASVVGHFLNLLNLLQRISSPRKSREGLGEDLGRATCVVPVLSMLVMLVFMRQVAQTVHGKHQNMGW